jgi:hypothetical protein
MVLGVEQTQPMDVAMKTATPPHELAVFFSSKTQGFRHSQRRPPTSPPNFKKPFGGVLLLGNLPKRPPNRDRKVGGLHLIWRSSFWSKRQDFRRSNQVRRHLGRFLPYHTPFLAEMTVCLVGFRKKSAKKVGKRAREPQTERPSAGAPQTEWYALPPRRWTAAVVIRVA